MKIIKNVYRKTDTTDKILEIKFPKLIDRDEWDKYKALIENEFKAEVASYKKWLVRDTRVEGDNLGKTYLFWGDEEDHTYIQIGRGGEGWWDVNYYAYGGGSGNDSITDDNFKEYMERMGDEFEEDKIPKLTLKKLQSLDILGNDEWGIE